MEQPMQIGSNQDKVFKIFLWLLSIVSLYNIYATTAFFQQFRMLKMVMGVVMIMAEVLLVVMAIRTYSDYKTIISKGILALIMVVILYNLAHIIYATIWDESTVFLSFFGNPIYQPAFMLPVAALLGVDDDGFGPLLKCVSYYTLLIIPIYAVSRYMNVFVGMGLLFLLAFLRYMPRKWRLFLLVFAVAYIAFSYYDDARAPILRVLMGLAVMLVSYTSLYKSKFLKVIIYVAIVCVPLYFLSLFVRTGYSVFEQSSTSERVSRMGVAETGDTRTFLYEEVFEDLSDNDAWIFGKGINGTYYSSYFENTKNSNEVSDRVLAEVGMLDFLLKGGIAQTVMYLLLLLIAVFKCFFFSNSRAMVLVGLILLIHYVFLFIEDVPRFDLFNVCIWFFIGMTFSPEVLEKDDQYFEDKFSLLFAKR